MGYKKIFYCFFIVALLLHSRAFAFSKKEKVAVVISPQIYAVPRIKFGVEKLQKALSDAGYITIANNVGSHGVYYIFIDFTNGRKADADSSFKEQFFITGFNRKITVKGTDASGILYGCMELADRITATGKLPDSITFSDKPEMVLRGACIGMQKPYYLPGRTVYEYPYTPETFPWFYNKQLWIQYLDSMVENRMNSLYLWNGHPFASLVKLKNYPYAVEVDDATFKKNEDIYRFITSEADKRGIWVIQMFYNIIVSKPFAEHNHIKTQERERPIIPLIADYTRKSIAAFIEKYPNVGLMVCLGEAMEGIGKDDIDWFTKTIIPGVKDGLKALGKTDEPPIVLRAHDTDAPSVMAAALPIYKNLYTEAKFNGEALTTPRPRGTWVALHQTLSKLGSIQIENVHILANLEPFRYGATGFIQECVKGMHEVMGGKGLHLYPQASYWDWPYSADSVRARPDRPVGRGKRLLQIERDWIWYKAWSRYAWKVSRDKAGEIDYWSKLLAAKYGCSVQDGKSILDAYEESGQIAPKLLRRFGITDGNRQTLTLGMLMTQLINPYRYGLFTLLYECESPEGEMLIDYAEKEWNGKQHVGETPVQIINEVIVHGIKAVQEIEAASKNVTLNKPEFERLKNDMYCYRALANHYAQKAEAALLVLRYKYSNDIKDLERALPLLEKSVASYKQLVELTKGTYLYANSMQTQQRKIPLRGVDGTFKTWKEVQVPFENELQHFKIKIDSLKNTSASLPRKIIPLANATVNIEGNPVFYLVDSLAKVFTDTSVFIKTFAKELKGLQGLQLSYQQQLQTGTEIHFNSSKPSKILVGYFNPARAAFINDTVYLKAPELETNASANNFGQSEIKIANAMELNGMPPVNIHSYSFAAGSHTLKLTKGICLIVGFVNGNQAIPLYDAGITSGGVKKEIDWLFE